MERRIFLCLPAIAMPGAQAPDEQAFSSLFDGRSLGGWSVMDGPESAFYAREGEILASPSSMFPAWLRSRTRYENFDLRLEFFVKGWTDGGVYIHAPEHGRNTFCGMQVKIFHQVDKEPQNNSMGSIYPLVPPLKTNVKSKGEWNQMRVLMDWPRFQVWVNGEAVQDLNCESHPDLRYRLRDGYIGLSALGYPHRFRNLRIRELPATQKWDVLYENAEDFQKWFVSESNARSPVQFVPLGQVLRGDGLGHIATKEKYKDFQLELYIRGPQHHNGGVLFRTAGKGLAARHYEIQLHNVEESHYPTGSLYYFKRSVYPRIQDEKWYLMQLFVQGRHLIVRVNGENVTEYDRLEDVDEGHVELQAHQAGRWLEYKHIRIRRI